MVRGDADCRGSLRAGDSAAQLNSMLYISQKAYRTATVYWAIEGNNRGRNTGIPAAARTTLCHSASVLVDGRRSVSGSGLDGWLGAAKTPCGGKGAESRRDCGVAVRRSDPSADERMGVGAVLLSPGEGAGECNMGGGRTKERSEGKKGP